MNQQSPFNKLQVLADPTAQIPLSTDALVLFKQMSLVPLRHLPLHPDLWRHGQVKNKR